MHSFSESFPNGWMMSYHSTTKPCMSASELEMWTDLMFARK